MIRRLLGFCFALLLMLAAGPSLAREVINSFASDIVLDKSGSMTVTETISVNAEGNRIRRGIFRDFPLTMKNADGRTIRVDFDVVSVKRDGRDGVAAVGHRGARLGCVQAGIEVVIGL